MKPETDSNKLKSEQKETIPQVIPCPICKIELEFNFNEKKYQSTIFSKDTDGTYIIECMHLVSFTNNDYKWHRFIIKLATNKIIYTNQQNVYTSKTKPEKLNQFLKPAKRDIEYGNTTKELAKYLSTYFSVEEKVLPKPLNSEIVKIVGSTKNPITNLVDFKKSLNISSDLVVKIQGLGWSTPVKNDTICQRVLVADRTAQLPITLYSSIRFTIGDVLHIVSVSRFQKQNGKFTTKVEPKAGGIYKLPFMTNSTNITQELLTPGTIDKLTLNFDKFYTIKGIIKSIGKLELKRNGRDKNLYIGLTAKLVSKNCSLYLTINRELANKFHSQVKMNDMVVLSNCKFFNYRGVLAIRTTEYTDFQNLEQTEILPKERYKKHLLPLKDTTINRLAGNTNFLGTVIGLITKPLKCKDYLTKQQEHRYFTAGFIDRSSSCYIRIDDDLIEKFTDVIAEKDNLVLVKIDGLYNNQNGYFRMAYYGSITVLNKNGSPFTPYMLDGLTEIHQNMISFRGKLEKTLCLKEYTKLFFTISGRTFILIAFNNTNRVIVNNLKNNKYYNVFFVKFNNKTQDLPKTVLSFTPFTQIEECTTITFSNDPVKIKINMEPTYLNELLNINDL